MKRKIGNTENEFIDRLDETKMSRPAISFLPHSLEEDSSSGPATFHEEGEGSHVPLSAASAYVDNNSMPGLATIGTQRGGNSIVDTMLNRNIPNEVGGTSIDTNMSIIPVRRFSPDRFRQYVGVGVPSSSDEDDIPRRSRSESKDVDIHVDMDMNATSSPSDDILRRVGWKSKNNVVSSPFGRASYNCNDVADDILEDIIRKTRRTFFSSAGLKDGRKSVGTSLPGWSDPTVDARHGLLLLPPPPNWTGSDSNNQQLLFMDDNEDEEFDSTKGADYIGDATGTIYKIPYQQSFMQNTTFNSRTVDKPGCGLANTPSHQEFFCVEAIEEKVENCLEHFENCMSIDD